MGGICLLVELHQWRVCDPRGGATHLFSIGHFPDLELNWLYLPYAANADQMFQKLLHDLNYLCPSFWFNICILYGPSIQIMVLLPSRLGIHLPSQVLERVFSAYEIMLQICFNPPIILTPKITFYLQKHQTGMIDIGVENVWKRKVEFSASEQIVQVKSLIFICNIISRPCHPTFPN